jgi:hypothetical protein
MKWFEWPLLAESGHSVDMMSKGRCSDCGVSDFRWYRSVYEQAADRRMKKIENARSNDA